MKTEGITLKETLVAWSGFVSLKPDLKHIGMSFQRDCSKLDNFLHDFNS